MLMKKHFKAIAEIINGVRLTDKDVTRVTDVYNACIVDGICVTVVEIGERLADYFATQNPHFDRQKFLGACGL